MSREKGFTLSENHKRKIGESNKISLLGNIPWNKGIKCPFISIRQLGNNNPCWKGGKRISSEGYLQIYNPIKQNYRMEHRIIIENFINRELTKNEHIHHIDGNRQNNNIKNLVIMNNSCHQRIHKPKIQNNFGICNCCNKFTKIRNIKRNYCSNCYNKYLKFN